MTFKSLFLSDIEYDKLKELANGTKMELREALAQLQIDMEPDRAYECIIFLDYWGQCVECGTWDEYCSCDGLCNDCYLATQDDIPF